MRGWRSLTLGNTYSGHKQLHCPLSTTSSIKTEALQQSLPYSYKRCDCKEAACKILLNNHWPETTIPSNTCGQLQGIEAIHSMRQAVSQGKILPASTLCNSPALVCCSLHCLL